MKKKIIAVLSGVASAISAAVIYDKFFNKSKWQHKILSAEAMNFSIKKLTHRDHHSHERFLRENPLAILLLVVLATVLIFNGGLQRYMQFFQTSVIQTRYTTEPFDGAVYPVDKVPKWTDLTTAERNASYSQIPAAKFMKLPKYNIRDFQNGMVWRSNNERQRNAYITYPVPNLGNYQLDGTENSGSHTGVDIKVPIGTPIRSISRGVVIKAENQPTGFGKHIVVMHKDVPDPQNPAKKTILYSAYAHLSEIKVRVGQQVQKGQVIGLSGDSGMATAPHLHFQIDTADAPFHPYWPITWSDVTKNGLSSFFDAVKAGINKSKARQYTVHPINLVKRTVAYVPTSSSRLVASAGISDKEISQSSAPKKTISTTNSSTRNSTNRRTRVVRRNNSRRNLAFKRDSAPVTNNRIRIASRRPNTGVTTLQANATKTEPQTKTVSTVAVNKPATAIVENSPTEVEHNTKYGDDKIWFEADRAFVPGVIKIIKLHIADKSIIPNGGVTISGISRDFLKISPTLARAEAFEKGYLEVKVIANSDSPFKIKATAKGVETETANFLAQPFIDVSATIKNRTAAKYVKDNNIMKGYANGEFKPDNKINRAESVKVILSANKTSLVPAKKDFQDVDRNSWFASYVSTAVNLGIVSGYEGNVFRPANEVTVAEFLKMSLVAKGVNPAATNTAPYKDIAAGAWYERYFTYARNNGLLTADSRGFIHPNKKISRMEAAYLLYKLAQL